MYSWVIVYALVMNWIQRTTMEKNAFFCLYAFNHSVWLRHCAVYISDQKRIQSIHKMTRFDSRVQFSIEYKLICSASLAEFQNRHGGHGWKYHGVWHGWDWCGYSQCLSKDTTCRGMICARFTFTRMMYVADVQSTCHAVSLYICNFLRITVFTVFNELISTIMTVLTYWLYVTPMVY